MRQVHILDSHLYIATSEIENTNHPLAYGINKTVQEFFNGPLFLWMGSHSNKIATFTGLQSEINSSVNPKFQKEVAGTPSWVHSTFGDGDVVLFAGHPEIRLNIPVLLDRFEWDGDPYYGRRTVHNALFYVTSDPLKNIETINDYPLSFLEMIGENTINLSYLPINESFFENIQIRLKKLNDNLSILRNISYENIELFAPLSLSINLALTSVLALI